MPASAVSGRILKETDNIDCSGGGNLDSVGEKFFPLNSLLYHGNVIYIEDFKITDKVTIFKGKI